MTVALLNLLAMGGGLGAAPDDVVTFGQQASILETCSRVDTTRTDLALRNTWATSGVQMVGIPEKRYGLAFSLTWNVATQGVRMFIRRHYQAYIRGGSQPFGWVQPSTGEQYFVRYAAPPRTSAQRRTAGTATVQLVEVFQTD